MRGHWILFVLISRGRRYSGSYDHVRMMNVHWERGYPIFIPYSKLVRSYGNLFITTWHHMVIVTISRLLYNTIQHHITPYIHIFCNFICDIFKNILYGNITIYIYILCWYYHMTWVYHVVTLPYDTYYITKISKLFT